VINADICIQSTEMNRATRVIEEGIRGHGIEWISWMRAVADEAATAQAPKVMRRCSDVP